MAAEPPALASRGSAMVGGVVRKLKSSFLQQEPFDVSAAWGTVRCHLEQAKEVHSDFAESLCIF